MWMHDFIVSGQKSCNISIYALNKTFLHFPRSLLINETRWQELSGNIYQQRKTGPQLSVVDRARYLYFATFGPFHVSSMQLNW